MSGVPRKRGDRFLFWAARYVAPLIVRALAVTLRVVRHDEHHWHAVRERRRGWVWACLHGRMFVPVWVHRGEDITTLVSRSRDGELVARLVEGLGHATERGSSHRGGAEGLRRMIAALRRGPVAMMVDGPRGPREVPKIGTVALARAGGVPVLPITASAERAWTFSSWDRFQLPRPFSRVHLLYGEPMVVERSAKGEALEQARASLQARLVALRVRADELAGREPGAAGDAGGEAAGGGAP
jgi:lysophospholipid acyltransferase (LPLAT)-like uncharacterized protein